MTYDPSRHHRRSVRLQGYDYTQAGAYFITICSRNRTCIFADIDEGDVRLTPIGDVVAACWAAMPDHFPRVGLDAFVVMPNHVDGILVIAGGEEGTACRAPTEQRGAADPPSTGERFSAPVRGSISTIIRSYKAAVTKALNDDPGRGTACRALLATRLGPLPPGRIASVWQSNYHEHVIRDERSLDRLREYIATNPSRWAEDTLCPGSPATLAPFRRPANWDGFFAACERAEVSANFLCPEERDQGVQDRDPFEGWVE